MAVNQKIIDNQLDKIDEFKKWFGTKEIGYLSEVMKKDEELLAITGGDYKGKNWIIIVSDLRVIFLKKTMLFGLKKLYIPMKKVVKINHKVGSSVGNLEIETEDGIEQIKNIRKKDIIKIYHIIQEFVERRDNRAKNKDKMSKDALSKLGNMIKK
ncbi:PH domain-containing protein [bacterium]|nr:PH domain-containing protein [bacterium]